MSSAAYAWAVLLHLLLVTFLPFSMLAVGRYDVPGAVWIYGANMILLALTAIAISLAMVVATVKATLVAGYFMHLLSEEKVIIWLLVLCAAFLVFLFVLPLGTETGNAPLWPLASP